ncbi:MAG: GntR family transcriptional regulator [Desulforhopalus sp.]
MTQFRNAIQIAKKSKYADIFAILRDRIVCLAYPPGTALNEKELCEEFGVSRTPLREAIRRLEDLNLVNVIPRFGTHVSSLDLNELRCAMQIKVKLEALASEAAARNLTPQLLGEMQAVLARLNEQVAAPGNDQTTLIATESSLHTVIWRAAANPLLESFLDNLQYRCARVWNSVLVDTIDPHEVVRQLTNIVGAIRERDAAQAAVLTEAHVLYFSNNLKDKLL